MAGPGTQWKDRLALITVGILLSLTMVHVVTSEPAIVGERRVGGYAVGCLPGGGSTEGAVCSLALGMPRDSRGEPWIAVHPDDSDIIAVAAIARSHADDADAARDPEPVEWTDDRTTVERTQDEVTGSEPARPEDPLPRGAPCAYERWPGICVHVTQDGGRNWVARGVPNVADHVLVADPVLLFTPDGDLHLFAHKANGGEVAHVHSEDLGRTWTVRRLLSGQGFDRPWGDVDPHGNILLIWQQTDLPLRSQAAYSTDQGATFKVFDLDIGCLTHGPPVHIEGATWWYACTGRPVPDVGVYAIDAQNETSRIVGDFHGWWRPAWTLDAGPLLGVLHSTATGQTMGRLLLQTTEDQGTTWNVPKDLLAVARVDDPWTWHWVSWATTDAAGTIHVLLVGGDTTSECYSQAKCPDAANDREVAWLTIDAATGDLLGETLLTNGPRERPADAHGYTGDDFHHMLRFGDGVLIAWGHERVVELAIAAPSS